MTTAGQQTFPRHDPVGAAAEALPRGHVDLIARVVADHAAQADASGVRRATLDELARNGLLGSPLQPKAAQRELAEVMAGSDATTWFCWVQHQTPLRTLTAAAVSPQTPHVDALQAELLPGLEAGRILAGVAFAHVRRPGPANPVASRVDGGWSLTGRLDWVTSWDIADVVMVMAQGEGADEGSLVCLFLPGGAPGEHLPGLTVGQPLDLLAMSGTHTRPLLLDDVRIPASRVAAVLDRSQWLAADAITSADANPAAFGIARAAIAELDVVARERADARMAVLVEALVSECRAVRTAAYGLADESGAPAERQRVRAQSLDLAVRAATAVVVARSGASMLRGSSAERRVREALFLQVQAQTQASRSASMELMIDRHGASPEATSDGP